MVLERIELSPDEIPKKWYNILPDLPEPLPPYRTASGGESVRQLPDIFTKTASRLEFSTSRWVDIPSSVREAYIRCGRPRPLVRANGLEAYLKTKAKIYYKCEDLSPVGTFKLNTAIPQAYWAFKEGYKRTVLSSSLQTRTHFVHTFAARHFGLTPTIFVPRTDYSIQSEQVLFLKKMFNADLVESPSDRTEIGRKTKREGSTRSPSEIARSEAVEEVLTNQGAVAVISSFLNHVLMTQTIMGLEVEKQLNSIDEKPTHLIAPVGGGSNFYGLIAPFMKASLAGVLEECKFVAVESETSSKLTDGSYGYSQMQNPMSSMLGKIYETNRDFKQPIAGIGIQTSNTAPILSLLRHRGLIDTVVYPVDESAIFEAARIFLATQGELIAPESAYAVRAAIDEALKAKQDKRQKIIVMSISAKSYLDFGEKNRYVN
ncbi:MAG: pyridoxal-phosphate dependent enzyme [Candidatus Bathyarchaeia archaeon]|jgi:tryptophan synthase beta chain